MIGHLKDQHTDLLTSDPGPAAPPYHPPPGPMGRSAAAAADIAVSERPAPPLRAAQYRWN